MSEYQVFGSHHEGPVFDYNSYVECGTWVDFDPYSVNPAIDNVTAFKELQAKIAAYDAGKSALATQASQLWGRMTSEDRVAAIGDRR